MYTEDEMLMLSGIQHFMFCPRQWALIHIEQQWADNKLTTEGNILHLKQGDEGVVMTESGRKTIISAWQSRKREQVTHPYINERVSVGLLPYVQSMLLARFIRKDLDDYPVFLIK